MYIKEIKDMINLMNENGLTELEIEKEGVRIRLKKGPGGIEKAIEYVAPAPQEKAGLAAAKKPETKNVVEIKAPMVGTFYRASSEGSAPYVKEGDVIEKGQVLCIVEAMKLMNEIESEVRGRIVSILVENAHSVEFGEPMFVIEKV